MKSNYYLVQKKDLQRLLQDAISHDLQIYHLREYDDDYYLCVFLFWTKKIIDQKMPYLIYQYSIGLFRFMSLYVCHKYRIIALVISVIWFIFLNHLTYGCIVQDTYPKISQKITDHCQSYGLTNIHYEISPLQIEDIQMEIHSDLINEVDYFDIYKDGKIYFIEYTKKQKSSIKQDDFVPLKSNYDAVIAKIDIVSGNVLVELGQYVSKGELLVSNEIIDTSNHSSFVPVEGKIYGYVYHTYEANMKGTLNPDTFTNLYQKILNLVKNEINDDGIIIEENVLQYQQKEGTIILRIQFTLYQNIATKEFLNEE